MENYLEKLKNKKTIISCIIPAYNEEKNISKVLEVVKDFPYFDEIIVVDDGSIDKTSEKAKKYNIKVIKHKTNQGKTATVKTGIDASKGSLIVLLDADLIGLTHKDIAKLIYLVLSKQYDLTILDRQGDREAIWGWTNCARLFSGEKCFWKKDFNEIKMPKEGGYLVDVVMNMHYLKENKRVRNIYCKNLYTVHQFNKLGTFQGYYNYIKVSYKYIKEAKVPGMIKQIKEIEDEYSELKKEARKKKIKEEMQKMQDIIKNTEKIKEKAKEKYKKLKEMLPNKK